MISLSKEYDLAKGIIREGDYLFKLENIQNNEIIEIEKISQIYQPLIKTIFNDTKCVIIKVIPEQELLNVLLEADFENSDIAAFLKKVSNYFLDDNKREVWDLGKRAIDFNDAPLVMGILNVTPDSFSDGGKFFEKNKAIDRALEMVSQGADVIDVGGESTRPGSAKVNSDEELKRVIPVIEGIRKHNDVLISIDSYKSSVADLAMQSGADIINDISGMSFKDDMLAIIGKFNCPYVLLHIQGTPESMQQNPTYSDVQTDVYNFLEKKCEVISSCNDGRIIIDPGFGFGKSVNHNLLLLRDLVDFSFIGKPILVGVSRKSFIGKILDMDVNKGLVGTIVTQFYASLKKANILRVHDVTETVQAKKMLNHILAA